jgi:hypothetical protein
MKNETEWRKLTNDTLQGQVWRIEDENIRLLKLPGDIILIELGEFVVLVGQELAENSIVFGAQQEFVLGNCLLNHSLDLFFCIQALTSWTGGRGFPSLRDQFFDFALHKLAKLAQILPKFGTVRHNKTLANLLQPAYSMAGMEYRV